MTREIESVHTFTREQKYRLDKELTVVRCDDSTVYEFEKPVDEPTARLTKAFQPDGKLTHTSGSSRLPAAVKETADSLLGEWSK